MRLKILYITKINLAYTVDGLKKGRRMKRGEKQNNDFAIYKYNMFKLIKNLHQYLKVVHGLKDNNY